MANLTLKWGPTGGSLKAAVKKLLDMGDGTHAEVIATVAASGAAPVGGGVTWGAPVAVANVGGASTDLVAAAAGRKAIMIWNPAGNALMYVDISGGAATTNSLPIYPGGTPLVLSGAECPVGKITFIGTAAQNLVYQQGT